MIDSVRAFSWSFTTLTDARRMSATAQERPRFWPTTPSTCAGSLKKLWFVLWR